MNVAHRCRSAFVAALLLIAAPNALYAQTMRNAVAYDDSYHLYQRDGQLTVVHLDLEWPRVIDNSRCLALQKALTTFFFADSTSYTSDTACPQQEAFTRYAHSLGNQLDSMPDASGLHKMYADYKLRMLASVKGRLVILVGEREQRDADSLQGHIERRYFNYDMIHDRMLSTDDVFNARKLKGYERRAEFEGLLYATAIIDEQETEEIRLDLMPQQVAILGDNVLFDLGGTPTLHNISVVPIDNLRSYLTKTFRQWQEEPAIESSSKLITEDMIYGHVDSLCLVADSMACYPNGDKSGVLSYLSKNLNLTSAQATSTDLRLLLSFIVEADGTLSHFVTLSPSQPLVDREVVKVLCDLPRWKPAIKENRRVPTRIFLPINLRLQ